MAADLRAGTDDRAFTDHDVGTDRDAGQNRCSPSDPASAAHLHGTTDLRPAAEGAIGDLVVWDVTTAFDAAIARASGSDGAGS